MENPWMRSQKEIVSEPVEVVDAPVVPVWHAMGVSGEFDNLLLVSAHNGAGTTSIATACGARECGTDWAYPTNSSGVVLVARGDMRGLNALSNAARAWSDGEIKGVLLGAVVSADHPKEIRELKTFREFVCRGFPRAWFLPFLDAWRLQPGTRQGLTKAGVKVLNELAMLNTKEKSMK